MKLAEALAQRADLQTRYAQLGERARQSARYQEGEQPPEDAAALLAQMDRIATQLEQLIVRINIQNLATDVLPGMSMTAALARRDTLRRLQKSRTDLAAGYPIDSGAVESANKLVVETRLKGAGMHWTVPNANGLLALRGMGCSQRWDASWDPMVRSRRHQRRHGLTNRPEPPPGRTDTQTTIPAPAYRRRRHPQSLFHRRQTQRDASL